jgi:hypothetical protein
MRTIQLYRFTSLKILINESYKHKEFLHWVALSQVVNFKLNIWLTCEWNSSVLSVHINQIKPPLITWCHYIALGFLASIWLLNLNVRWLLIYFICLSAWLRIFNLTSLNLTWLLPDNYCLCRLTAYLRYR